LNDQAPTRMGGTVLAFDFGTRRIGVAVGERETGTAHPLETIEAEDNLTRFARIGAILKEWRPVELVVGLPVFMDGTTHEMTLRCQRFANQLRGRYNLPVHFADERLTSADAATRLFEAGGSRFDKAAIDALAAQRILLDHLARTDAMNHDAT